MKLISFIISLIITLFILFSCSNAEINKMTNADAEKQFLWIEGNYLFKSSFGGIYFENWKKIDSLNYNGLGYYMDSTNVDTLFRQAMNLEKTANGVYMHYHVKNQNDNKVVEFKLTKQDNQMYTFENSFRDYPSIITYKIINDTSVNVVMRGFKKGAEKKEDFIISK